jgi:hypothetical protein
VVLPFDSTSLAGCPYAQGDDEANAFGAALANATTPLFILHSALGLDAADVGSSSSSNGDSRCVSGHTNTTAAGTSKTNSNPASPTSPAAKVMSWISRTAESLADINHAASPVEAQKRAFLGTSRAQPLPTKSTRPSTGVRGPCVEDPVEAARSCGVHVGGLTTVLVSGVHLYEKSLRCHQPNASASRLSPPSHTGADGSADSVNGKRRINASATLLFPSTTCCGGSVSSLLSVPPNAAVYDAIPTCQSPAQQPHHKSPSSSSSSFHRSSLFKEGAKLHEDDGGAEDETAHDPQTATSVYTVQQVKKLHQHVCEGAVREAYTTVWYRHVFVDTEEVTSNVLCGVSQWWLQRPVHLHELPSTTLATTPAQQPDNNDEGEAWQLSPLLHPPLLHVKFMADIGANLWWPHRLLSVVHHRFAQHRWHTVALLRWAVLLWLCCAVLMESVVHGVPDLPVQHAASRQGSVDLVASFRKMGEVYGGANQLAALDVSHTGVRGVHLLACALGKVLTSCARPSQESNRIGLSDSTDHFGALDVAGCIQLHHRPGELHLLAAQLDSFLQCSYQQVQRRASPLPLVDLLTALSLSDEKSRVVRSATGLALALLSHHGRLTWLSGAGCSLDNAALHELGQYALLVEAVASASRMPSPPTPVVARSTVACSICAMDLTSALSLDDVNPVAYLTNLEQLLVPFTYVTDDGVARLDGHTYPQDLRELFALYTSATTATPDGSPAQALVKDVVKSLEQFTASSDGASSYNANRPLQPSGSPKTHNHAVEALYQRFRSHLYHIDFTYCSCLSSVTGLVRQQRLELLNLSQTRINKAGLFSTTERSRAAPSQSTSSAVAAPPLRLFVAEMCEHLNDLGGLAHISTLECVIARSGSLGDDGLRSLCTKDMRNLQLMDLSYCDRLHHVGCLANLPALETLILDSTDVTPAEVRQLRQSRSLKTLSVRFCTEFAFIGKEKKELEEVVGEFPNLKHYIYEDLIGDEKFRKKTS